MQFSPQDTVSLYRKDIFELLKDHFTMTMSKTMCHTYYIGYSSMSKITKLDREARKIVALEFHIDTENYETNFSKSNDAPN